MNILFVCTANRDRSRTAEMIYSVTFPVDYIFRSAGINKYLSERHGGIHLKKYMLDIADRIICMEQCHSDYITSQIDQKYAEKIRILHVGDTDTYMSESLIRRLIEFEDFILK